MITGHRSLEAFWIAGPISLQTLRARGKVPFAIAKRITATVLGSRGRATHSEVCECSSVVYCGRRCQRADWEERHRIYATPDVLLKKSLKHTMLGTVANACVHGINSLFNTPVCKSRWTKIIVETCSLASPVVSRMEFHTIPFKLSLMELKKYQPLFVSSNSSRRIVSEGFSFGHPLGPPREKTGLGFIFAWWRVFSLLMCPARRSCDGQIVYLRAAGWIRRFNHHYLYG
ncbi:hypothetical protein BKA70DRAFT_886925 [Coprinopsis sp. MPI-PUGE-AT-0042]|nr:hypothetical protein BKA70DRAFT_886925 [Coprinopsis sp. MPI-PUGE-AT-0042]